MNEVFGKYELVERIGVGGMAEVYRAKTFGPEGFVKEVVIKRILPAFNEDPDFVRMFINEARLAAMLQHTNIVQIFDFNHVDGLYYIAMEWVDGTDLKRVLNRARSRSMPVSLRTAIHVGVEALKGLHYAHTKAERGKPLDLVHRDISPHNLLLSLSGEVKITDFGIAKVAALASATRSGMLKGKLAYMSPEQCLNEPLDGRSDIFSLGIVVWELLTGRRLYQGDSEAELFSSVKRADVPALRSINESVPAELEQLVLKMLARSPDDRFATAADTLNELSRFAVVGAALEVSDYLHRLLPGVAGRDRRGETAQLAEGPVQIQVAAPNAPTRTRGASEDERPSPATLAGGAAVADSPASPAAFATRPGARPRWLAPVALFLLIAVAVVIWSVARQPTGKPVAPPPPAQPVSVNVAVPVGAELLIDGVSAGRGPREVSGAAGTRLRLEVRSDGGVQGREVSLGEVERVVLGAPAAPSSNGPADAAAAAVDVRSDAVVAVHPSHRPHRGPGPARPKAPVQPPPGKRPEPIKVKAYGTLDVLVSPWAKVKINGRGAGVTPLRGRSLPAGRHWLELRNTELNKHLRLKVEIKADQTTTVRRMWD